MTMRSPEPIKSIVIVGGGTAGWISASVLAHVLKNTGCKITLIESPHIPIIGVGEATIPSFVDLLAFLKISEPDFIEKTQATFKLGIKFSDWKKIGESYWHPFGVIGSKIDGKDFYQHWLKSNVLGQRWTFTDFSPAVVMAKHNKFSIPNSASPNNLSKSAYALHFDAGLAAQYLSVYATNKGVEYIRDEVVHAALSPLGHVAHLQLASGTIIKSDFYIDASGSHAQLMDRALGVEYENWSKYLPADTAVVVQSELDGSPLPYTTATAHETGWRWNIPLQHRMGNGYVFSSQFTSKNEAMELLINGLKNKPINQPRFIHFMTGKRKKIWHKNCLSVGLSSGFLEPLESTSIYLAMKGILNFVQLLPNNLLDKVTENEYNRLMDIEYECIRDFIVLHYCATQRDDTDFWRTWQTKALPESLNTKIDYFKSQGRLLKNPLDLFASDSWYAVFEGMGIRPVDYDHGVDASDVNKVHAAMSDGLKGLNRSVSLLPTHEQFLSNYINTDLFLAKNRFL